MNAGWVPTSIIDKVTIRADVHLFIATDPTFTCLNSPMQTPEQWVKSVHCSKLKIKKPERDQWLI